MAVIIEDYGCRTNKSKEIISTVFRADKSPFECIYIDSSIIGSKDILKIPSFDRSGAYILWRVTGNGAITAYVGQSTNLMKRFESHFKRPEGESYRNDWTFHLGITRIDTDCGFSNGEICSLEHKLNTLIHDGNNTIQLNTGGTSLGIGADEKLIDSAVEFMKLIIQEHFGGFLGESHYSVECNTSIVDKSKLTRTDYAMFEGEVTDIPTPDNIVKEMVDLIPLDKFTPSSKFLDLAAKRGEFLREIRDRLLEAPAMKEAFPARRARLEYIENNMLYGVCLSSAGYDACMSNLEIEETEHILRASPVDTDHLHGATYYIERIKGDKYAAMYKGQYIGVDALRELTRKFGDIEDWGENIMKFDVVIGNPPYNNDMYLDFVKTGYDALKPDGKMIQITPAKFQAKGGKKNEDFRANIVPHMKEIVYYPSCGDIFDVGEWGGVCYYYIDKDIHNDKIVKCMCDSNKYLNCDNEVHSEKDIVLMPLAIKSIVDKCRYGNLKDTLGFAQSYHVKNTEHGHATKVAGDLELMAGNKIEGYVNKEIIRRDRLDKYKCITSIIVSGDSRHIVKDTGETNRYFNCYCIEPNQVPKGSFPVLRYFDTRDEAESFVSFTQTKLVQFLFVIGITGTTLTAEFWRFVPDPGAFDHIFTDAELYQKYSLTQDEINIIESVIKERK